MTTARFKKTGKRDDIFLATKFGGAAGIPGRMVCGDPEYVPKAIDKSLERLGVDYIDLWYLHRYVERDINILKVHDGIS